MGVIKCRTLYLAHLLDPCSDYLTTVCIYSWEKTTWQLYSNILSGGDSVDIAASELRWFLFGSCCFGNSFTPSSHSPVLASCDFAHFSKPLFYLQDCQLMVRRGFPGKSSWPWRLHLSHTRFVLAFYGYWLYDAHLCGCLSKNQTHFSQFSGRLPQRGSRAPRSGKTCPRHSSVLSWDLEAPFLRGVVWGLHTFSQLPRLREGRSVTYSTRKSLKKKICIYQLGTFLIYTRGIWDWLTV